MTNGEFKELDPIAAEYLKAYMQSIEVAESIAQIEAIPDSEHITAPLQDQLEGEMFFLNALEEDATIGFAEVLSSEHPDISAKRQSILANQPRLEQVLGQERAAERIQQQLDSLPIQPAYTEETTRFAQGFFAVRALLPHLGRTTITTESKVARNPATEVVSPISLLAEQSPEVESIHEFEPQAVTIDVYKANDALVINGNDKYPLKRKLGNVTSINMSIEGEKDIAKLRLDAFKFLLNNPDTKFKASEVWDAIMPAVEGEDPLPYERVRWGYIHEFLQEISIDGKQLITDTRPTPQAKIRHYQLNPEFCVDMLTNFHEYDEACPNFVEPLFETASGTVIAGRTAQVLNALMISDEKAPLTLNKLCNKFGVIRDSERRESKIGDVVALAKSGLRHAGILTDYEFESRVVNTSPDHKTRNYGHWMRVKTAEDLAVEAIIPPDVKESNEERNREGNIHYANVLAKGLIAIAPVLDAGNQPVFSQEVASIIAKLDQIEDSTEDLETFRLFDHFVEFVTDEANFERLCDTLHVDDPRIDLVDYLRKVSSDKDTKFFVRSFLKDYDRQKLDVPIFIETAPVEEVDELLVEANLDLIEVVRVRLPDVAIEPIQADHPRKIRISDAKDVKEHEKPVAQRRREAKLRALVSEARPHITEAISSLREARMTDEEMYEITRYARLFPALNNKRFSWPDLPFIKQVNDKSCATRADVLLFLLGLENPKFQGALNVGFKVKALREVIDQSINRLDRKNGND